MTNSSNTPITHCEGDYQKITDLGYLYLLYKEILQCQQIIMMKMEESVE
jgi:hypothetical protein